MVVEQKQYSCSHEYFKITVICCLHIWEVTSSQILNHNLYVIYQICLFMFSIIVYEKFGFTIQAIYGKLAKTDIYNLMEQFELVFHSRQTQPVCWGCYTTRHQFMNQQKVFLASLPLTSWQCDINILNSVANISITQHYNNPSDSPLDVQYSFPTIKNACLVNITAEYGETRVNGVVKQRQQVERQYENAVQNGENIFFDEYHSAGNEWVRLKVGKVPPKRNIKIQIAYIQELSVTDNSLYQITLKSAMFPKQLREKDNLQNGKDSLNTQDQNFMSSNIKIHIRASSKIVEHSSSTHTVDIISEDINNNEVVLRVKDTNSLHNDLIFCYGIQRADIPQIIFSHGETQSSAIVSFIPRFNETKEDSFQKIKGEYIFLLDRSFSMSGIRIQRARQALILFVKSLPVDSYFNIVSFGSQSNSLFPESVKYTDNSVISAISQVQKMQADLGGTYIYGLLEGLMTNNHIQHYPKQIYMLTDGDVPNAQQVIKMVSRNNHFTRVHAIGVGKECSQELIVGCSQKGRGSHVLIDDHQCFAEKIIELLKLSISPIVYKMQFSFDKGIVKTVIPNPQQIPFFFNHQAVNIYLAFKQKQNQPTSFLLKYRNSLTEQILEYKLTLTPSNIKEDVINKMVNFRLIQTLQGTDYNMGELDHFLFSSHKLHSREEIVKKSIQHQIVPELTDLVCLENQTVNKTAPKIQTTSKQLLLSSIKPPSFDKTQEGLHSSNLSSDPIAPKVSRIISISTMPNLSSSWNKSQKTANECDGNIYRTSNIQKKKYQMKTSIENHLKEEQNDDDDDFFISDGANQEEDVLTKSLVFCQEKGMGVKESQVNQREVEKVIKIIMLQSINGVWKELSLIQQLYSKELREQVGKDDNIDLLVTYLVSRWIQKHHPEPQYTLITQKAFSFVKKNTSILFLDKKYSNILSKCV